MRIQSCNDFALIKVSDDYNITLLGVKTDILKIIYIIVIVCLSPVDDSHYSDAFRRCPVNTRWSHYSVPPRVFVTASDALSLRGVWVLVDCYQLFVCEN